jgi:hypothetical protein
MALFFLVKFGDSMKTCCDLLYWGPFRNQRLALPFLCALPVRKSGVTTNNTDFQFKIEHASLMLSDGLIAGPQLYGTD